jgi:predicted lipid-binding transport protein (Tim44 family)
LQVLELIIFAVLAAVVLYQLYSVLGRRVGRQPEDNAAQPPVPASTREVPPVEAPVDGVTLTGLAALRSRDPAFDVGHFLHGSKQAFEMVVRAFAAGDRDTLKNLLSPQVADSFNAAIDAREAEGRTETVEFLHAPRADLERVDVAGDTVKAVVRFLAEFRSRTKGPEGEGVDDRRTAELWTFERNLGSRDPNWTLVHVDAAEA